MRSIDSKIYSKFQIYLETRIKRFIKNINENNVTIDKLDYSCRYFKISKNEMLSSGIRYYKPRQTAIYLAMHVKSLPEIGRCFSNRIATVIHSVKTIDKLRKEDNELNLKIDTLKNKILYTKEDEI